MFTLEDIQSAQKITQPYIKRTPQWHNATLTERLGTNVYLKMELFQKSGSFKPRGAFNQMLTLGDEALSKGVVAVSGGNFAQAVAYASGVLGVSSLICMAQNTPQNYVDATKGYGAEVELLPDVHAAFARVDELVAEGRTALHAFDNPYQMAGNGTAGLEIYEDLPDITDIFVSIGGGGLIGGVAVALKSLKPSIRIWGVETKGAEGMKMAMDAGKVVTFTPSSLSKTLGPPYVAEDALKICQEHLEDLIVVSDEEAILTQQFLMERAKIMPELAASCTLAAADRVKDQFTADSQVVLLMCGGNESVANIVKYAGMV